MKTVSVEDVKAKLGQYVKASEHGPIVIMRNGKAVAALIALAEDEQVERLLLGQSPKLRKLLAEARARPRGRGGESPGVVAGRRASHPREA